MSNKVFIANVRPFWNTPRMVSEYGLGFILLKINSLKDCQLLKKDFYPWRVEHLTHCYQTCFSEFIYHDSIRLPSIQNVSTECSEFLLNILNVLGIILFPPDVFMISFVFLTSCRKILAYLKTGNN